jgi:hypothetical protein
VTDLRLYPVESARVAIILAHGAGAGQSSPFMVAAAKGLASRGVAAATFDFGYIAAGRKVPDAPAVLEQRWRDAIGAARHAFADLALFIGGKSMGGRIASQVAAQGVPGHLAGLVFLGYPLHPPGKPQQRRDAHLPSIREPMLFVQGSRDTFGTASEIGGLIPRLQRATLHEVVDGDHSLKVPAGSGRPTTDVFEEVLNVAVEWMTGVTGATNRGAQDR